jgi:hypothetical protein
VQLQHPECWLCLVPSAPTWYMYGTYLWLVQVHVCWCVQCMECCPPCSITVCCCRPHPLTSLLFSLCQAWLRPLIFTQGQPLCDWSPAVQGVVQGMVMHCCCFCQDGLTGRDNLSGLLRPRCLPAVGHTVPVTTMCSCSRWVMPKHPVCDLSDVTQSHGGVLSKHTALLAVQQHTCSLPYACRAHDCNIAEWAAHTVMVLLGAQVSECILVSR